MKEEADDFAHKYADIMLELDHIQPATRIMTLLLEKTQKQFSDLIPISFNFIRSLIDRSQVEGARDFVDQVISLVSTREKLGNEGKILAATTMHQIDIRNVLTEEQFNKLKTFKPQKRRDHRSERRHHGRDWDTQPPAGDQ